MLAEMFKYLTTPVCCAAARKLGYLHEAIALEARYKRCRHWWQAHYQRCREEIVQAASVVSGGRALILGGGLLHDVPLEALTSRFEQVDIVDLVFLRSARKRVRRANRQARKEGGGRIRLVERDVTEALCRLIRQDLTVPEPQWGIDGGYSLVVSLNMVTQLPLLPSRYLMKRGVDAGRIERYGHDLIAAHLDWLRRFPEAHVCLIADLHIDEMNRGGALLDRVEDPWWHVDPPPVQSAWQWEMLPLREGRNRRRVHHVGVAHWVNRKMSDVRQAAAG